MISYLAKYIIVSQFLGRPYVLSVYLSGSHCNLKAHLGSGLGSRNTKGHNTVDRAIETAQMGIPPAFLMSEIPMSYGDELQY